MVAGLSLASLYASRREPPLIRIGGIKPVMNFSTVRVQGFLESTPRALQDGVLFFRIADESGALSVFLHRAAAEPLPPSGSRLAVTGRLSVGPGRQMSLRVKNSGQIERLEAGGPSTVEGRVAGVWTPPPDSRAPYRIFLERPEGRLEVIHWFAPARLTEVGERIEAKGVVGFYKGRMQIKVREAGDIRSYPEP